MQNATFAKKTHILQKNTETGRKNQAKKVPESRFSQRPSGTNETVGLLIPTRCRNLHLKQFCLEDIAPAILIILIAHIIVAVRWMAYQNLISGDKRSKNTQGNCSVWLLPRRKYYTQNRPKNQDTAANSLRRSSPDVIGGTYPLWMGADRKIYCLIHPIAKG